jgi:hypothetical protein
LLPRVKEEAILPVYQYVYEGGSSVSKRGRPLYIVAAAKTMLYESIRAMREGKSGSGDTTRRYRIAIEL